MMEKCEREGLTMAITRAGEMGRFGLLALAALTAITAGSRPAIAQQVPVADDGSGMQVLTQGPVHTAGSSLRRAARQFVRTI
jgi:hypothetical protein